MSGSGMIDGRRAELLGDDSGAVLRIEAPMAAAADGYSCRDVAAADVESDEQSGDAAEWFQPLAGHRSGFSQPAAQYAKAEPFNQFVLRRAALGIICIAAAKCTEVQSLADCGRIDRDGADLFARRYSESICDIVAALTEKKGN